jgi:integrase
VDHDARIVRLRPEGSKTGEGRVLALSGELWDIIERRGQERGLIPWVFHRKGLPIGDIRKAWKTACRKAGAPGKLFHDLRRTAVRDMV